MNVLFLCVSVALFAGNARIWCALDADYLELIWSDLLTVRLEAGIGIDEGFALRIPLSWVKILSSRDVSYFDLGLFLDYHPFENGFFISLGVAQGAFFLGRDRPQEDRCFLNEIAVGYRWDFSRHWFLEPKLQIRDPSGMFSKEMTMMKDVMGEYPLVRFSLLVGMGMETGKKKGKP